MNLSIVHIVEEKYKDKINELAFILGMGSNNLSIELSDGEDNIYYGCHSWWTIKKYIMFKDHHQLDKMGINIDQYKLSLLSLREFLIDTTSLSEEAIEFLPLYNWENALLEMNLTNKL